VRDSTPDNGEWEREKERFLLVIITGANNKTDNRIIPSTTFINPILYCSSTFKFSFLLHESPPPTQTVLKKKSGKNLFSQNKTVFLLLPSSFVFSSWLRFFVSVFFVLLPRFSSFPISRSQVNFPSQSHRLIVFPIKQTDLEFCDLRVGKINTKEKAKKRKNAN
jgi:hypothetical protein